MTQKMSQTSMRTLLSKFEPVSPPESPAIDRIKSSLDGPKATLSAEASKARQVARATVKPRAKPERPLPQIHTMDTDEIRHVKRAILARDQEIRDAVAKLNDMSKRLARLADQFSSSVVADDVSVVVSSTAGHDGGKGAAASPVMAFSGSAVSTPGHSVDAEAAGSARKERMSATAAAPTSLEAILAAARGGQPRAGGTDRPKYAKLLRDLK